MKSSYTERETLAHLKEVDQATDQAWREAELAQLETVVKRTHVLDQENEEYWTAYVRGYFFYLTGDFSAAKQEIEIAAKHIGESNTAIPKLRRRILTAVMSEDGQSERYLQTVRNFGHVTFVFGILLLLITTALGLFSVLTTVTFPTVGRYLIFAIAYITCGWKIHSLATKRPQSLVWLVILTSLLAGGGIVPLVLVVYGISTLTRIRRLNMRYGMSNFLPSSRTPMSPAIKYGIGSLLVIDAVLSIAAAAAANQ